MKKLMVVAILLAVAMAIVNLVVPTGTTDPDVTYPMANRNIKWYYAGK
jgi:hypothetical protein